MKYFAGIDPTQGGVGRTRMDRMRSAGDDFAMSTVRAELEGPVEFVNLIRMTGITADQQSAIVHRQNMAFDYELMVMDPSGGGLPTRDKLREPDQSTGAEDFRVRPLITIDDEQMAGAGDAKLVLFGRSDSRITGKSNDGRYPGVEMVLTSESVLPNKMHELFRGALEADPPGVRFPAPWDGWKSCGILFGNNPNVQRDWLNERDGLTGRDRVAAEFDLALHQLNCVHRELDSDMQTPLTDKTGNYTFDSLYKKDAAYSMIYAFFAVWIWRQEQRYFARKKKPKQGLAIRVQNL